MKRETRHIPVLLDDVLDVLDPQPGQTSSTARSASAGTRRSCSAASSPAGS